MKKPKITHSEWLAVANAVATGASVLKISHILGTTREFVRTLFDRPTLMDDLVREIGSPSALDEDALVSLFYGGALFDERRSSAAIRHAFADAVREAYPDYFRKAERAEEHRRRAEERRRLKVEREAELAFQREEEEGRRRYECQKADRWNLKTLCILNDRDWRCGTGEELARGLATEDARKAYRLTNGLRWTSSGFGPYGRQPWSATRCRMEYELNAIDYSSGWIVQYEKIVGDPDYAEFHRITADGDWGKPERIYQDNPFAQPRDQRFPVIEDDARRLYESVKARGVKAFRARPPDCLTA